MNFTLYYYAAIIDKNDPPKQLSINRKLELRTSYKKNVFKPVRYITRKCIEGSSHYLGDKQDFDVSSKGPSSGN